MREELVNKISEDILNIQDIRWNDVQSKVNEYSKLLKENIRNFYELEMEGSQTPLFALCYYLRAGRLNFSLTIDEYEEVLHNLEININEIFHINLVELGFEIS